jgi:hypothetical protein
MASSSEFQHELLRMDPDALQVILKHLAGMLQHNGYNVERILHWLEVGSKLLSKTLAKLRPVELIVSDEKDGDGDVEMVKKKKKRSGSAKGGSKSSKKRSRKHKKDTDDDDEDNHDNDDARRMTVTAAAAKKTKKVSALTATEKSSSAKGKQQATPLSTWTDEQQLAYELTGTFERDLTIVIPAVVRDRKHVEDKQHASARHVETVLLFAKNAKVGKPMAKLIAGVLARPRWKASCFVVISQRGFTSPSLYTSTPDMVDRVRVFMHHQLMHDVTAHVQYSFRHVLMDSREQHERLQKLHGLQPGLHEEMVRLPRLVLYTDPMVNHGDFRARSVVKVVVPGVHDEYCYI